MGCSQDDEVDPEEQQPSREEVREALRAQGYTEIDFEAMEARANRMLQELHVRKVLKRFEFDFTHLESPEKPKT